MMQESSNGWADNALAWIAHEPGSKNIPSSSISSDIQNFVQLLLLWSYFEPAIWFGNQDKKYKTTKQYSSIVMITNLY